MSGLHVHRTDLPGRRVWTIQDDTVTLDLRPGRLTNGGRGWARRADAEAALALIEAEAAAIDGYLEAVAR